MKIGFLGGSFDPVHFGHLVAAQDALEQQGLDRVVFLPAAQAPLKPAAVVAPSADRIAMLEAATAGNPSFEISDLEIRRGGTSYTVDTVRELRSQHPDDELFWIIGADQLHLLPDWMRIEELATMVAFLVLERPGHEAALPPILPGLRVQRCPGHLLEISSSELRERVRRDLPLDYFVPAAAIGIIKERKLYR